MSSNSSSSNVVSPHPRTKRHLQPNGSTQAANTNPNPWTKKNPFAYKMQSILQRGKALLTPSGSSQSLNKNGFTTVKDATALFPATNPAVDGEDCLHDCASCTAELPRKWSIDEEDKLFGHVNGWESHVIVATGKTDWVRDITDEKGSVMEKIGAISNSGKSMEYNGRKVMLSASDIPTGNDHGEGCEDENPGYPKGSRTRCIVLPSWKLVEGVGTDQVEWMMGEVVSKGSSNVQRIKKDNLPLPLPVSTPDTTTPDPSSSNEALHLPPSTTTTSLTTPIPQGITLKPCPHRAIILMCSHKTRDWRCGASAPLLRKEFERHLRPLGLYRDIHDERPGGVGVYFINHVGGHKYSANVMVYRRQGRGDTGELSDEAVQGIWLARVRPEDCENIVKYTVLQGKLVKPGTQLRGGFDRESGLISW